MAKYGSLEEAQAKIKHWRVNWPEDESTISVDAYNILSGVARHYFNPSLGYDNRIAFYERKQIDDIRNTNRTIKVPFTSAGYTFQIGMRVRDTQVEGNNGEIDYVAADHLILKNVNGSFSSGTLYDSTNEINTFTSYTAQTLLTDNLIGDESYWAPVTYYNYEIEYNEKKKNIKLLEKSMLSLVTDNLRDALQR